MPNIDISFRLLNCHFFLNPNSTPVHELSESCPAGSKEVWKFGWRHLFLFYATFSTQCHSTPGKCCSLVVCSLGWFCPSSMDSVSFAIWGELDYLLYLGRGIDRDRKSIKYFFTYFAMFCENEIFCKKIT